MGIQFITGDLSQNKKKTIIHKLLAILEEEPKSEIYYLVPEHLKFDMETFMLEEIAEYYQSKQSAMMNIQVASFTRLAWFLMKDEPYQEQTISDIGLSMIIRQILTEEVDSLIIYRGQVDYQGFIDKLLDLFTELYQGNIEEDNLYEFIQSYFENLDSNLSIEKQRLTEISFLYEKFLLKLEEKEIRQHQQLRKLSNYLLEKGRNPNLYIVIDHYYYFNAEQMNLVINLGKFAHRLWITLPIDSDFKSIHPMLETPYYTYHLINDLAKINMINILDNWNIKDQFHSYHSELYQLSQIYKQQHDFYHNNTQVNIKVDNLPFEVWQTDSIQSEIIHVSNQIHYLVSQQGYRYKDILVVTRDLEKYVTIVKAYFKENDIPVFIDHRTEMRHHAFILFVEGLLNICIYDWQYEDLMKVINSEFILPDFIGQDLTLKERKKEKFHQIKILENILLANGYFSYRFTNTHFQWNFPEQEQRYYNVEGELQEITLGQLANLWRQWLIKQLYHPLINLSLNNSGKYYAEEFYLLIQHLQVPDLLIEFSQEAVENGQVEKSQQNEQVWNVFVQLIEEFYSIYQDTKLSFKLFGELLIAGLNQAIYHIIPATMDQVLVSNMVSPQVAPYKICFIIGMDSQTLPQRTLYTSLLGDNYREALSKNLLVHQYLMKINEQQNSQELLLTYQLLLSATEKLYCSYATTVNNVNRTISPYLEALLNELTMEPFIFNYGKLEENQFIHPSYYSKYPGLKSRALNMISTYYDKSQNFSQDFLMTLKSLEKFEEDHHKLDTSFRELLFMTFFFNQLPSKIDGDTALALFGKNLYLSVSRIEQYYRDPYSHFLIYGLKLQKRKVFDLDYARSGDFFHDYLDYFTRYLIDHNHNITELSLQDLERLFISIEERLLENPNYQVVSSDGKYKSIYKSMVKEVHNFIHLIQNQSTNIMMRPIQTEAVFGLNPSADLLDSFNYQLPSGGQLSIRGKIDRIDSCKIDNQDYLQIIDYKSSKKDFNIVDLYYGLDLQIMTYLSVALKNYPNTTAFGAFYQPILQDFSPVEKISDLANIESLILKKNRLDGFLTVESDILKKVDASYLLGSNQSLVYKPRIKNDGNYYRSDSVYSQEELSNILTYVHYLFNNAAIEIQKGQISLMPYKNDPYAPSLHKDYRVISGFDGTIHYSAYREKEIKKDNVLDEIKTKIEEVRLNDYTE